MEGEALARLELQAFWEPAQGLGRGCGESGSCRVSPTYCSGSEVWDQENMLGKKKKKKHLKLQFYQKL